MTLLVLNYTLHSRITPLMHRIIRYELLCDVYDVPNHPMPSPAGSKRSADPAAAD